MNHSPIHPQNPGERRSGGEFNDIYARADLVIRASDIYVPQAVRVLNPAIADRQESIPVDATPPQHQQAERDLDTQIVTAHGANTTQHAGAKPAVSLVSEPEVDPGAHKKYVTALESTSDMVTPPPFEVPVTHEIDTVDGTVHLAAAGYDNVASLSEARTAVAKSYEELAA